MLAGIELLCNDKIQHIYTPVEAKILYQEPDFYDTPSLKHVVLEITGGLGRLSADKFLSDDELRSIRYRAGYATPGPWHVHETKIDAFVTDKSITSSWESPELRWPMPVVTMTVAEQAVGVWMKAEDADFISQARMDIPALLDMLDVIGHKIIYSALMEYAQRRLLRAEDTQVIERAMEVSWRILKSRDTARGE